MRYSNKTAKDCKTDHEQQVLIGSEDGAFAIPSIQFPGGHDHVLRGMAVSICKVDGGFFLATGNKQFTPSDSEQNDGVKNLSPVKEFKPDENEKDPHAAEESLKGERPGRNSNPSRLRDRQS